jgi:hypothetical protein
MSLVPQLYNGSISALVACALHNSKTIILSTLPNQIAKLQILTHKKEDDVFLMVLHSIQHLSDKSFCVEIGNGWG